MSVSNEFPSGSLPKGGGAESGQVGEGKKIEWAGMDDLDKAQRGTTKEMGKKVFGNTKQRTIGRAGTEAQLAILDSFATEFYGAVPVSIEVPEEYGGGTLEGMYFSAEAFQEKHPSYYEKKGIEPEPKDGNTVFMNSGSEGNAKDHVQAMAQACVKRGKNVFFYNYQGFGKSNFGDSNKYQQPCAESIKMNAEVAVDWLLTEKLGGRSKESVKKIIFEGYSLGSAAAAHAAAYLHEQGLLPDEARILIDRGFTSSLDESRHVADRMLQDLPSIIRPIGRIVANGKLRHVERYHNLNTVEELKKITGTNPNFRDVTAENDPMKRYGPILLELIYGGRDNPEWQKAADKASMMIPGEHLNDFGYNSQDVLAAKKGIWMEQQPHLYSKSKEQIAGIGASIDQARAGDFSKNYKNTFVKILGEMSRCLDGMDRELQQISDTADTTMAELDHEISHLEKGIISQDGATEWDRAIFMQIKGVWNSAKQVHASNKASGFNLQAFLSDHPSERRPDLRPGLPP